MTTKQKKLVEKLHSRPIIKNIKYLDVESLLLSLGAKKVEGSGSRVKFLMNDVLLSMHKPHPRKEMDAAAIKDISDFLNETL